MVKLATIMCLNQTKVNIEFDQGIYFDEYRDQFFRAGVLIDFKIGKIFLKALIAKKNEAQIDLIQLKMLFEG